MEQQGRGNFQILKGATVILKCPFHFLTYVLSKYSSKLLIKKWLKVTLKKTKVSTKNYLRINKKQIKIEKNKTKILQKILINQ